MIVGAVMRQKLGTEAGLAKHALLIKKVVIEANAAVADELLDMAKKIVPVDTGALKDSGRVSKKGFGWTTTFIVGFGGNDPDFMSIRKSRKRSDEFVTKVVTRRPYLYAFKVHQTVHEYLAIPVIQEQKHLGDVLRLAATRALAKAGGRNPSAPNAGAGLGGIAALLRNTIGVNSGRTP